MPPHHVHPPPCMPPLPCIPPLPCMPPCHPCPPAMHAPLPCTPTTTHDPCHTHPPPCIPHYACPPVDRILDTRFWKYYLAPTSLQAVIMQTLHLNKVLSNQWTIHLFLWLLSLIVPHLSSNCFHFTCATFMNLLIKYHNNSKRPEYYPGKQFLCVHVYTYSEIHPLEMSLWLGLNADYPNTLF